MKPKYEWCITEDVCLEWLGFSDKKPKTPTKVRCPHCKKNIRPFVRECHDHYCWHLYMPKHKKRLKNARKVDKPRSRV
jgi:hypothetical protein